LGFNIPVLDEQLANEFLSAGLQYILPLLAMATKKLAKPAALKEDYHRTHL